MLARWCLAGLALVLVACARSPVMPAALEACAQLGSGTSLLAVQGEDGVSRQLVLHSSRESKGLTLVALNTIGAPQFTARLAGGDLQVERRPGYRGPDPQWLLWGWQWWQLRDNLQAKCAGAGGYLLKARADTRELRRGGRVYWQWDAGQADHYQLPQEGLSVRVRAVE